MELNLHGRAVRILGLLIIFATLYHFAGRISLKPSTARSQDANPIPTCIPDAQGNVNYNVVIQTGKNKYWFGDGVGCVNRPLIETWAVTQNPEEMGVPDLAQSTVKAVVPPPAGSTHLYDVTYKIHKLITISWTLAWLHTLPQGTLSDPKEVLISISKISGSSLVSHFTGTIRLTQISPKMTLVATHQELAAPGFDESDMNDLISEIINRLRIGTPDYSAIHNGSILDFE